MAHHAVGAEPYLWNFEKLQMLPHYILFQDTLAEKDCGNIQEAC